jgi:hypothetical protein
VWFACGLLGLGDALPQLCPFVHLQGLCPKSNQLQSPLQATAPACEWVDTHAENKQIIKIEFSDRNKQITVKCKQNIKQIQNVYRWSRIENRKNKASIKKLMA